jgi:hypothetical protein
MPGRRVKPEHNGTPATPMEQYRQAIEQYFNTISEKAAENPAAKHH